MKIGIASHIVLDTIKSGGSTVQSLGGPACYCGITARRFGFDVELATRVGSDFPDDARNILRDNNIPLKERSIADGPTTRFMLEDSEPRKLVLQSKCRPISEQDIADMKVDCWIASPVIDEIPASVLEAIKKNRGKKDFVMLDPQGYMREVDAAGGITLKDKIDIDLAGITAIKADSQELAALTDGLQGVEGMKALQARGVDFVVTTEHRVIHMLHKDMHYWIKLRDIDTPDATGAGDIIASAFTCAWVKEKDALWALCFGAGALRAALETGKAGLAKIPPMSKIESSASYFYNTVSFKDV
ncbi:PfkB family carbohydrate kinase [Nitrososphaera sp.]|uniref:PfkB family carbohydrate kinase n=1 Tax=Nitrososphaera sp. TaxID=1971748 RepID=UPI0018440F89|nr:PfkB family carbohydrate kinase [Nitrososphaera sp.]NWG37231.1 ribokinase [Nitrososphaera sp.]